MTDELVIDSFAGGGGASAGIEAALGRAPDIAINHDAEAIAMHRANHPDTFHLTTNIWRVDPYAVAQGRPVGLMWASPDCKHFSKAKGGKPVKKNIRDLAWVVFGWAKTVRPRVIILENVEEFKDWGPLDERNMPCRRRKGREFKRFNRCFRRVGYTVEYRELVAARYQGVRTTRKRLYWIARCDGNPIVWPKAECGAPDELEVLNGKLPAWGTAAQCIDWSIPTWSIFITKAQAKRIYKQTGVRLQRPLACNSQARIARGVKRYVIDKDEPFIVPITHSGDQRVNGIDEPHRTTTCAQRGEHALVMPFIAGVGSRAGQSPERAATLPLGTVTATKRGQHAVIAPLVVKNYHGDRPDYGMREPAKVVLTGQLHMLVAAGLINTRNGERKRQAPRVRDVEGPAPTATAIGSQGGIVTAFLAQNNTDMVGHDAREPLSTIVQKGCTQAVVSAGLISLKGTDRRDGEVQAPTPSQTAGGTHIGQVEAHVAALTQRYFGTEQAPRIDEPLGTATTRARDSIVAARVELPPLTAEQLAGARRVARFLRKFGCWDGGDIVVTKSGAVIIDIGMRMLVPRELFRAQGFSDAYVIAYGVTEKGEQIPLTKSAQIRLVGNSVCPGVARALVAANYAPMQIGARGVPAFAMTAAE